MFWKNKKIFITGGKGFVGSYLKERLLKEGADLTLFQGNILKDNFNLQGYEYFFHLAAIVGVVRCNQDKGLARLVNVKGTENLLRGLESSPNLRKFIYTSTINVYGNQKVPIKETSPTKPIDFYAKTKLEAEKKVLKYKNNFPIAIIRISNIYGPGQKGSVAIPRLTQKIRNTLEFGEITVGEATRDFIYIEDVIEGILSVAKNGEGIYNLGSGKETSIKNIASIIAKYLTKSLIIKEKSFNEMKRSYFEISKIRSLGWAPRYDITKGLENILKNE